jgi:hypothetical protein
MMRRLILLVALGAVADPAFAAAPTAAYDARVRETRRQLFRAQASGDVVTIANARAKFKAASATAWSKRHPAPQPTPQPRDPSLPR